MVKGGQLKPAKGGQVDRRLHPYPVSYKGQYFYRSGSTKQELKGAALDKFLLQKQGKRWDAVPVPHVSEKDLSKETFNTFRKGVKRSKRLALQFLEESNEQLLEKLKLIDGTYLKRAALLLFHEDPETFVTGTYVKIGYFRTDDDLLYQDTIHGSLFDQADKTLDLLLTKYLKAAISYEGINRVETFPFPEEALRETIVNAVAHKDYSSGIPIQISVYADKIVFWNPGQLPDDWTVARLTQKHPSVPFNPDIAALFFRAGYIESWGRGIEKIAAACKAAGIPFPQFDTGFSGLMVTYTLGEKLGEKLTPNQLEIVKEMTANNRITFKELSNLLHISEVSIHNNVSTLRKKGIVKRVGPAKGGYWEVL